MSCGKEDSKPLSPPVLAAKPRSPALESTSWPSLPRTAEQVQRLLKKATRRPPRDLRPRPKEPAEILARIAVALAHGQVFAGWRQIVGRIEDESASARKAGVPFWLLWGTYHDAPLQIEAFRRLIGPGGVVTQGVALEQFDASGHWKGLKKADQVGDDSSLASYLESASSAALAQLRARQRINNYTGWKYGYLPQVLDLVLQARASGTPLWPCDMSRALQRHLHALASEGQLLRLREFHCALSLRARQSQAIAQPRAVLWGQDHIGSDGFGRFLSPRARVVALYVFGGRKSPSALEPRLARRLALAAPLLIADRRAGDDPRHRRWILLLPGEVLRASVARSREPATGAAMHQLEVRAPSGSVLRLGARRFTLGSSVKQVALKPGEGVFALEHRARLLMGSLDLAREGTLALEWTPARRAVDLRLRAKP